jgi:hypothetical protein
MSEEKYSIYFQPATVKKYLTSLIKHQSFRNSYYPIHREYLDSYFEDFKKFTFKNEAFNYDLIKYSINDDIDSISKIIANQGKSGFSFLQTVEKTVDINQPVLLFYGIEHLSSFFFNLHFNFTNLNKWEKKIKSAKLKNIRNHGIASSEFNTINQPTNPNFLSLILNKKIRLIKNGLCSRFFLAYNPKVLTYFYNQSKISLVDLIRNFFIRTRLQSLDDEDLGIGVDDIKHPIEIRQKFVEHFGYKVPTFKIESATLTIYLLAFLFSHLSRYKMNSWIKLLNMDENNLSYFIKYILKYGKEFFLELLFKKIKSYEITQFKGQPLF